MSGELQNMSARQNLPLFAASVCVVLCSSGFAGDRPEPPEAISYSDIGRRFYIEGDFGKLYADFKIRGIVLKPIGKGDENGKVRLEITHVLGKQLEKRRTEYIVTDSQFEIDSEVELLVREEAQLWYPEGIDDMGSNPDASHLHKLRCVVSLHQRKILSRTPSEVRTGPAENKNSKQAAPEQLLPADPFR